MKNNHLTKAKIFEFISLDTYDNKALEIASEVTAHTRVCSDFRKEIRRMQDVYDIYIEEGNEAKNQDKFYEYLELYLTKEQGKKI